jgi:hypothetical protein
LEDLAPGSVYSLTEGCSNKEAQEALLQLAALHAGFFKLNKEDASLCKADWAKSNEALFDATNFEKYVHSFLTNHKEIIDSGWDQFLVNLTSSIHALLKEMKEGPQSIMHCDFKYVLGCLCVCFVGVFVHGSMLLDWLCVWCACVSGCFW